MRLRTFFIALIFISVRVRKLELLFQFIRTLFFFYLLKEVLPLFHSLLQEISELLFLYVSELGGVVLFYGTILHIARSLRKQIMSHLNEEGYQVHVVLWTTSMSVSRVGILIA